MPQSSSGPQAAKRLALFLPAVLPWTIMEVLLAHCKRVIAQGVFFALLENVALGREHASYMPSLKRHHPINMYKP